MEEFADVARARASWNAYVEAMTAGREIMRRAGVPDPPPIPEFDIVFRRLNPAARKALYAALRERDSFSPAEAVRVWQPVIKRAFAP